MSNTKCVCVCVNQRFLKGVVKNCAGTRENRNAKHLLENIIKVWSYINTCKKLEHGVIKERNHLAYKSFCQVFSLHLEPLMPGTLLDI